MKVPNNDWDFEDPLDGHEVRFLRKLEDNKESKKVKKLNWTYFTKIAAVVVISATVGLAFFNLNANDVAPTPTDFYAEQVALQIEGLKALENNQTKPIISDAIEEIKVLENDYLKLEQERKHKGLNEALLNAMIVNMQMRLSFLQKVQAKIKMINELNDTIHEDTL